MNPPEINKYSVALADVVGDVLDQREFPVVLGGDCSIVLGAMLALRRRGRYGLLYRRAHGLLPARCQPDPGRRVGERPRVRHRARACRGE